MVHRARAPNSQELLETFCGRSQLLVGAGQLHGISREPVFCVHHPAASVLQNQRSVHARVGTHHLVPVLALSQARVATEDAILRVLSSAVGRHRGAGAVPPSPRYRQSGVDCHRSVVCGDLPTGCAEHAAAQYPGAEHTVSGDHHLWQDHRLSIHLCAGHASEVRDHGLLLQLHGTHQRMPGQAYTGHYNLLALCHTHTH